MIRLLFLALLLGIVAGYLTGCTTIVYCSIDEDAPDLGSSIDLHRPVQCDLSQPYPCGGPGEPCCPIGCNIPINHGACRDVWCYGCGYEGTCGKLCDTCGEIDADSGVRSHC